MNENTNKNPWWSPEFGLVLAMLVVLTILVVMILRSSTPQLKLITDDVNYLEDATAFYQITLDYRKDILAIVLTAFGAWVGAGAAYFFGRENLRESANSLLSLHKQMTGLDKLKAITVRDIPPKPLDVILDDTAVFKDVMTAFEKDPKRWFVPFQSGDKFYILKKDSLFVYLQKQMDEKEISSPPQSYADIKNVVLSKTVKDVVQDMEADENLKKLLNPFIPVIMDANVASVNEQMQNDEVFLAIVKDLSGKHRHFFTTNDIRKAMLKI